MRRFDPGRMSLQAGLSPAQVIAPVRPVTWQPAPDREDSIPHPHIVRIIEDLAGTR